MVTGLELGKCILVYTVLYKGVESHHPYTKQLFAHMYYCNFPALLVYIQEAKLEVAAVQEFEKLAPLKDELEQLREHTSQQDHELRRLTDYNNDLTGQMQSMLDEREKSESELYRKANDYDTLMGRLTDLQQTRVSLENELQLLREERASILRENAHLREVSESDSQNYTKLKMEYESLATHCQQLEPIREEKELILHENFQLREVSDPPK